MASMAQTHEDRITAGESPPEDELGAARGILVASVCGGLAWGVIALSSWRLLFHAVGSD
jgi:hypothetical protein